MNLKAPLHAAVSAAVLIISSSSCGSTWQTYEETLVRSQITPATDAPEWVRGKIQTDPNELAFVGRGGAYNVLDERKAFDEAFMHAREQLAQYVGTRVISESCDQDWAMGTRYLPLADAGPGEGEQPGQALRSRAKQVADAIVGELLPVAQYWEQWDVEETPERDWSGMWFENEHRFDIRRYKCWVLATIKRERVDKYISATLEMLSNEAEVSRLQAELEKMKGQPATADAGPSAQAQIDAAWKQLIQSKEHEIQSLRERIHYGRAFRLTTKDRCAVPEACTPVNHPQWRVTGVELGAKVDVNVTSTSAAPEPQKSSICDGMPLEGK
jgi:hypothetical protein